jgi:hypothetical protein
MDAYKFPDETTPIVQEEIEVDIVDDVPEGDRNRRHSQRVLNLMRMN